jgi:hypothetical protein
VNLHELEGLVPEEVCNTLYDLASCVPPDQAIVEIGSYKGKSTCFLAAGAKNGLGARVWAVDPWDLNGNITGRFGFAEARTREMFRHQVEEAGLSDHITAIRGFSIAVAKTWDGPPIGLLYVDGDHREAAVRGDWNAWQPHLVEGATVVFDDLDTPKNPGVRVVVDELSEVLGCEKRAGRLAIGTFA